MMRLTAAIFGCAGPALQKAERAFFHLAQPWGFILFARNVRDRLQLRRLTAELRDAVGWRAPVLIDQEGGRVDRMRTPEWRTYLPALDQMDRVAVDSRSRAMWLRSRLIADQLHDVGIDVNCAPLADIAEEETHPVLLNRLYGRDPGAVIRAAKAVIAGHGAGGVMSVLKHIPGYGRAKVDSHLTLPRVALLLEDLELRDFVPFRALADCPIGMSAHIVIEALDPDAPVTVSAKAINHIRDRIGFGGLLMTDDISMNALDGTVAARSRAAIAAGCDLVLHCNGDLAEMEHVAEACGPLSGRAKIRADNAARARPASRAVDIPALEAELRTLIEG